MAARRRLSVPAATRRAAPPVPEPLHAPALGPGLAGPTHHRAIVATVTAATLGDLPLALPPWDAQLAIADLLDALDALDALDEKIPAHREIISTTEKLRSVLGPALLTGAIRPPDGL